ncbi:MAG: methylated-DNA--[protein]-cysteine S-methyltransferase [Pseudomonadota bacterium]
MKPNQEIFCAIVPTPFGALGIRTSAEHLERQLVYLPPSTSHLAPKTKLAEEVGQQIERYCDDCDFVFDLPLMHAGTIFQQKVWQAIAAIPRGAVQTYGEIARRIGSAPRAVGQACGANWFPLVIPCHRVTAATGLGGFSNHAEVDGFHLGVKRWLLAHEGLDAYA